MALATIGHEHDRSPAPPASAIRDLEITRRRTYSRDMEGVGGDKDNRQHEPSEVGCRRSNDKGNQATSQTSSTQSQKSETRGAFVHSECGYIVERFKRCNRIFKSIGWLVQSTLSLHWDDWLLIWSCGFFSFSLVLWAS